MAALVMPRQRGPGWANSLIAPVRPPAVMAAAPTVTTSAAPTLPRPWPLAAGYGGLTLSSSPMGGCVSISRCLASSATTAISAALTVTAGLSATPTNGSQLQVSFLFDGTAFEFFQQVSGFGVLIRVDGEFVTLTPQSYAAFTCVKLDFGSAKLRRIDLIGGGFNIYSLHTAASDTIMPAPVRGPRVICFGDSFTSLNTDSWTTWFGDALGWDDVWTSGLGGTGFVAANAERNFKDRVALDVLPYAPDVVVMMGSRNDWGQPAATVQANVASSVAQIRAALPRCDVIVGHNASGGVETLTAGALAVMDATRAGALAAGALWANPVELPMRFLGGPPPATTTFAAVAAGRAGFSGTPATASPTTGLPCNNTVSGTSNLRIGATVDVGTGATRERIVLTGLTVVSGKPNFAFDGTLQYAHPAGDPVTEVGPSMFTGRGWVGAPSSSGWGNAGQLISGDAVHPSAAGQRAIGLTMAGLVRQALAAKR